MEVEGTPALQDGDYERLMQINFSTWKAIGLVLAQIHGAEKASAIVVAAQQAVTAEDPGGQDQRVMQVLRYMESGTGR